ncbi:MAG: hypothetical protein ACOCV1_00185 [Bacillota bacterium]
MKKITKQKLGSFLVSILFGISLGWYISSLILKLSIISFNPYYIFIPITTIIISIMSLKTPKSVELFAFIFSSWVALQFLWDFGAETIFGSWRTIMSLFAIGIFILNGFTGYLKFNSGWKTLKRAMGGK